MGAPFAYYTTLPVGFSSQWLTSTLLGDGSKLDNVMDDGWKYILTHTQSVGSKMDLGLTTNQPLQL